MSAYRAVSLFSGCGGFCEGVRLAGFAVIAAPYVGGSQPLGSLAIVGPVRMDYERVIPLVDYTARALSRILEQ